MKDVAHVAGKDWLGSLPEPGPAFYIGAEDDEKELHIRLATIAKHYNITFKELVEGGLHVLCLLGQDATLCAATGKSGRVETTQLFRRIYEAAGDLKPKNISIDTLSRAFAGSEIDRVQVYGYAMHMQALAMVAGGSVTTLSHPSLAGIQSGSGISGSTAWHGAFRFRQYLRGLKPDSGEEPDGDLRQFEFKKNQYGPLGETIVVRYQRGLFLQEASLSGLEKIARETKADDVFLELLGRFNRQDRTSRRSPALPTRPRSSPMSRKRRKPRSARSRWRTPWAGCSLQTASTSSNTASAPAARSSSFRGRSHECRPHCRPIADHCRPTVLCTPLIPPGGRHTLPTARALALSVGGRPRKELVNRHARRRAEKLGRAERRHRENRFYEDHVRHLPRVPIDEPPVPGRIYHLVFHHDDCCSI
jgi:hypothetical protein